MSIMRNFTEANNDNNIKILSLKPTFYYTSDNFVQSLTDREEQKGITANYIKKGNNRYIYFYKGNYQLGYLRLLPQANTIY